MEDGYDGGGSEEERRNPPQQKRLREKHSGLAVESMHFGGHLLHRVCGVTGKLPAGREGEGGPDESDRPGHPLLEDSGEEQLVKLRRNPTIMDILLRLKMFSVSLVAGSSGAGVGAEAGAGLPKAMGGRRGEAGCVARSAMEGYLRLFEEMLTELLRIQREKSKVCTETKLLTRHSQWFKKTSKSKSVLI